MSYGVGYLVILQSSSPITINHFVYISSSGGDAKLFRIISLYGPLSLFANNSPVSGQIALSLFSL